ncbi:MAG: ribosome small subunit-dependent GTPase A [Acidimicrobiia bacterium]
MLDDDAIPTGDLVPYGWDERWAALASAHEGATPGRVLRHDGVGLVCATENGVEMLMLGPRLDPMPVVGDWIVVRGEHPVAVLERTSLLTRRAAIGNNEQSLAANVDLVLLVCGLDRPVKPGRIERGAALAHDAGARPYVVLTKAALVDDGEDTAEAIREELGLAVLVTSVKEGRGLDELRRVVAGHTVVLLGESGAGKSRLTNALVGADVATVGAVRAGDAKGRHTTTTRQLHLLPDGGTLIDTPGIRAVGLGAHNEGVEATFTDIDDLADQCRFNDCTHDREPGCAVREAIESGELDRARFDRHVAMQQEADAAARRASPGEVRRHQAGLSRYQRSLPKRKK